MFLLNSGHTTGWLWRRPATTNCPSVSAISTKSSKFGPRPKNQQCKATFSFSFLSCRRSEYTTCFNHPLLELANNCLIVTVNRHCSNCDVFLSLNADIRHVMYCQGVRAGYFDVVKEAFDEAVELRGNQSVQCTSTVLVKCTLQHMMNVIFVNICFRSLACVQNRQMNNLWKFQETKSTIRWWVSLEKILIFYFQMKSGCQVRTSDWSGAWLVHQIKKWYISEYASL